MKGVLDFIELRMLKRVNYIRKRNTLGESHIQSYVTPSVFMLGGFWARRESTLLSSCNSMESKTPFIRKYSVVL